MTAVVETIEGIGSPDKLCRIPNEFTLSAIHLAGAAVEKYGAPALLHIIREKDIGMLLKLGKEGLCFAN